VLRHHVVSSYFSLILSPLAFPVIPQFLALSLHDALPILFRTGVREDELRGVRCVPGRGGGGAGCHRDGAENPVTVASGAASASRSEEHTSELQSLAYLVCRLLLEKKIHLISLFAF